MTILNYQSPFTGQEIDVYLAKAATALQADTGVLLSSVDDVPVDGATMAPISSNWAYDHAAGLGGHVFTQAGTGAVARTLEAKLKDAVSVKDFGAVGDGVADDAPAIRAALLHVHESGGGTVFFPPGVYLISRDENAVGVPLYSKVSLVGAGVNATALKGKAGTGTMHLVSTLSVNQSYIAIRDMTLDHNAINLGASASCHALRFNEASNVWIDRIAVKNSDHHGILTVATSSGDTSSANRYFYVTNVYLENIGVMGRGGGDGIRLFVGADRIVVNNIICNKIEYHGIHVGKGAGTVSNVQIFNAGNTALELQSEGVLANNIHIEWDDVISDTLANRPAAGTMGRLFWAADTDDWYRDNGTSWVAMVGNVTGVWAVIRDGVGWNAVKRLALSNIKCVLNVVENQPFLPTTGDAVRISGESVQISNFHVYGPFRFGVLSTNNVSHNLQITNATIDGVRYDGIRLDAINSPVLTNVNILSAGTETDATYYGINLRGTQNARILSSYINDVPPSPLIAGVFEGTASTSGTKVVACHLNNSALVYSGRMNGNIKNTGYITSAGGVGSITASNTTATVTHGLSTTPGASNITVTQRGLPSNDVGMIWISDITNTTFRVNIANAPGTNPFLFAWRAGPN